MPPRFLSTPQSSPYVQQYLSQPVEAFGPKAQNIQFAAQLAEALADAYGTYKGRQKERATGTTLADILSQAGAPQTAPLTDAVAGQFGPRLPDPIPRSRADQQAFVRSSLLGSDDPALQRLGSEYALKNIMSDAPMKGPAPSRTTEVFENGRVWEVDETWNYTDQQFVPNPQSKRPKNDEQYRTDLMGDIIAKLPPVERVVLAEDATSDLREQAEAAHTVAVLRQKKEALTNDPRGNLLTHSESKDYDEQIAVALKIAQGPTFEEDLERTVEKTTAVARAEAEFAPPLLPVTPERLAQNLLLKRTPTLAADHRFKVVDGRETQEVEIIPGTPTYRERNSQRVKSEKAFKEFAAKTENNVARIDRVVKFYDESWLAKKGLLGVGAIIPSSDWKEISNELETLRGVIGFDQLQQMRENSPTGGALGQVSTFELDNLQAILGRLDPKDPKGLVRNLRQIKDIYNGIVGNLRTAYNQDFGLLGEEYLLEGEAVRLKYDPETGDIPGLLEAIEND